MAKRVVASYTVSFTVGAKMHSDTRTFIIISVVIAAVGSVLGGWIGNLFSFPILGVLIGGVSGAICGIILALRLDKWAMDETEKELQNARRQWRQPPTIDRK